MYKFHVPSLIKARVRRGWSQECLADAASLTSSTVSRIERGKAKSPNAKTIHAIAAALDLDPEQLGSFVEVD